MSDKVRSVVISIIASAVTTVVLIGGGVYYLGDPNGLFKSAPETAARDASQSDPEEAGTASKATIPDIVESTVPAVVSIVVTADVPVIERYYEEFSSPFGFFGGFQVPRERQVGTEEREIGGGTGFFVSEDGYIVTNRHVVSTEGASYSAVTNTGETYEVEVVDRDPSYDIAILKVDAPDTSFPHLTFAEISELRLGETVIAIGNALAEFPNSISVGVISGLARDIVASDMFGSRESLEGVIQTDAAINRGNSGGPLLDTDGEVIGVNVAVAGNSENIGFALPADIVADIYASVREHGEIVRPFLGVRYLEITDEVATMNNLPVEYGALITSGGDPRALPIVPGSPADKAGLSPNDIILEINGEKLDDSESFAARIRSFDVGETITLTVRDGDEEREIEVTLEEAPDRMDG